MSINPTAALAVKASKEARTECELKRQRMLDAASRMRRLADDPDPEISCRAKGLLDLISECDSQLMYFASKEV